MQRERKVMLLCGGLWRIESRQLGLDRTEGRLRFEDVFLKSVDGLLQTSEVGIVGSWSTQEPVVELRTSLVGQRLLATGVHHHGCRNTRVLLGSDGVLPEQKAIIGEVGGLDDEEVANLISTTGALYPLVPRYVADIAGSTSGANGFADFLAVMEHGELTGVGVDVVHVQDREGLTIGLSRHHVIPLPIISDGVEGHLVVARQTRNLNLPLTLVVAGKRSNVEPLHLDVVAGKGGREHPLILQLGVVLDLGDRNVSDGAVTIDERHTAPLRDPEEGQLKVVVDLGSRQHEAAIFHLEVMDIAVLAVRVPLVQAVENIIGVLHALTKHELLLHLIDALAISDGGGVAEELEALDCADEGVDRAIRHERTRVAEGAVTEADRISVVKVNLELTLGHLSIHADVSHLQRCEAQVLLARRNERSTRRGLVSLGRKILRVAVGTQVDAQTKSKPQQTVHDLESGIASLHQKQRDRDGADETQKAGEDVQAQDEPLKHQLIVDPREAIPSRDECREQEGDVEEHSTLAARLVLVGESHDQGHNKPQQKDTGKNWNSEHGRSPLGMPRIRAQLVKTIIHLRMRDEQIVNECLGPGMLPGHPFKRCMKLLQRTDQRIWRTNIQRGQSVSSSLPFLGNSAGADWKEYLRKQPEHGAKDECHWTSNWRCLGIQENACDLIRTASKHGNHTHQTGVTLTDVCKLMSQHSFQLRLSKHVVEVLRDANVRKTKKAMAIGTSIRHRCLQNVESGLYTHTKLSTQVINGIHKVWMRAALCWLRLHQQVHNHRRKDEDRHAHKH